MLYLRGNRAAQFRLSEHCIKGAPSPPPAPARLPALLTAAPPPAVAEFAIEQERLAALATDLTIFD